MLDPIVAAAWLDPLSFDCTDWAVTHPEIRMAFSLLEPFALIRIGFLSSSPHGEKMFELPRLMHRGNCMLSLLAF